MKSKTAVALACILALLAAPLSAVASSALPKVVVADARTTHHLNLYVAQELDLFKKHGVKVEIIDAQELSAARDLVVAGQADVFWACPTVAIAAIGNGAPLRVIAQVKTPCTSVLLVPQDSPIKTYADLKGKKIGGISPTCEAVIAYSQKARAAGGDFLLEKLAGGPAIAALEAGAVDGVILEEPHVSIAELKGYKVVLRDAAENVPCRTINARTAFIVERADALKRLVAAIDEANTIILEDPAAPRIVEIAEQYTGAPADAIRHGNHRLKFTVEIQEEGLNALGEELLSQKSIRENPGSRLYAEEFRGQTWGKR